MKKLLLLSILTLASFVEAQVVWTHQVLGFPVGRRVQSISYVDANNVWCHVGYNGPLPAGDPQVQSFAKSSDGGATWTNGSINISNTDLGIGNLSATSASVAYVAAFVGPGGPGGGIWKTIDGGSTWTKQTTASFNSSTSFTNLVHFFNENDGFCMGDPANGYFEIYTTTNGGTNWTRVPSSQIPLPLSADEYGLTNLYQVKGDTIWFGTTAGRLFKSINRGLNWTVASTPVSTFSSTSYAAKFDFEDQNNGILIDSDYGYQKTSDGGLTWQVLEASGVLRNSNISCVPGYPGAYVINGDDLDNAVRGSSYTLDGGITWEDINPLGDDFAVLPDDIKFFNTTTGLSGGLGSDASTGGIFQYVGNLFDNLANNNFSNDKAFTASPNPTSGLVTIAGKGISNVVITDVLGKQVANTNFTSVETATIDMSSYNAGVYLVKVTNANGNASTIKVVRQ